MTPLRLEVLQTLLRKEGRGAHTNEVRDMAAELIERRRRQGTDREWISVLTGQCLPALGSTCEVWISRIGDWHGYSCRAIFYAAGWDINDVTHWRHLPTGPNGEQQP